MPDIIIPHWNYHLSEPFVIIPGFVVDYGEKGILEDSWDWSPLSLEDWGQDLGTDLMEPL